MTTQPGNKVAALLLGISIALAVGCAHPIPYGLPGPTPSPAQSGSPGPSPSPGASTSPIPCGSPAINATEFIAMTSTATATMDPTYGAINGYTDQFIGGVPSSIANVIQVNSSAIIQFVNLEPLPQSTPQIINHSAAALPTAFPSPSYTFPPEELGPLGSQISTQPWSTGPVTQDLSPFFLICYSQPFTLPTGPGVYPFGDLTYFGLSNARDVIAVSASAPTRHFRFARLRRATPPP